MPWRDRAEIFLVAEANIEIFDFGAEPIGERVFHTGAGGEADVGLVVAGRRATQRGRLDRISSDRKSARHIGQKAINTELNLPTVAPPSDSRPSSLAVPQVCQARFEGFYLWLISEISLRKSNGWMVEPRGFEPLTSAVRLQRSPN